MILLTYYFQTVYVKVDGWRRYIFDANSVPDLQLQRSDDLTWKFWVLHAHTAGLSGYHADTPITIKAEAIHEADSRIH